LGSLGYFNFSAVVFSPLVVWTVDTLKFDLIVVINKMELNYVGMMAVRHAPMPCAPGCTAATPQGTVASPKIVLVAGAFCYFHYNSFQLDCNAEKRIK
jgi:hypothetical protein